MGAGGTCHLYVYYRVAGDTAAARATADALLDAVLAETGVAGRLLARCDNPATWMEVYELIPDRAGFARALDSLVSSTHAADIAADGVRHAEWFGPPPDAAGAGAAPAA